MKTLKFIASVVTLCLLSQIDQLSTAYAQGSLTPPGPPAPTMKTLDQVEPRTLISSLPYVISTPGSYALATNLTGVAAAEGITITADDVVPDLKARNRLLLQRTLNSL